MQFCFFDEVLTRGKKVRNPKFQVLDISKMSLFQMTSVACDLLRGRLPAQKMSTVHMSTHDRSRSDKGPEISQKRDFLMRFCPCCWEMHKNRGIQ